MILSKILFIDDDRDEIEIFGEALRNVNSNIQLVSFNSSTKFMNVIKESDIELHFNIIFLDLNMPLFTGMDCLMAIRKSPKWAKARVIIYTTSNSEKDISEAYEKGANLYIQKPNTIIELQQIIEKVLYLKWHKYDPQPKLENFVWGRKGKMVVVK